jgi:thymidine phosphorylase
MASNRSTAKPASAETSKSALAGLARHTARIQIAALTAAGNAVAGWAHAADRLAQSVGDELLRRVDGEVDTGELIARVASATNVHLRELTALPSAAADHFNARLSRVSINQ